MSKLQYAFETWTSRAQAWPQDRSLKLPRGVVCAVFRADADSALESGRRARRRRPPAPLACQGLQTRGVTGEPAI
eukprot:15484455-Alexandrium_andersonii.AAC.1